MPTYGRRRQLLACLESLAHQTLPEPWEVIVVDDGSPEPALEAADRIARKPGWRLIRQDNAGPSAARNRGVREARGEFVALTDDDCRPEPAWLATLVQAARERPGALVGGTTFNGLPGDLFASTSQAIVDMVYEQFNADPTDAFFLTSNNMLCQRSRYLELAGFDETFSRAGAEDREFCDRWRMAGWPIVWRPDARVEHRHAQTLRTFLDLHYRYGRGAYRYQASRRDRGSGTMREDMGFHLSLGSRIARLLVDRGSLFDGATMLIAFALWQAANAVGFGAEALSGGRPRRP